MRIGSILFITCAAYVFNCEAQNDSTSASFKNSFKSVFVGYNFKKQHYFELGFMSVKDIGSGHHPFGIVKSISSEIKINPSVVFGPKLSLWAYGGSSIIAMGINAIDYFDTNGNNSFVFRPDIGVGVFGIKIVYGWNIPLLKSEALSIEKSQFTIQVPLKIKVGKQ